MTPRRYATPAAFKQALEQRLRTASATGTDFARRRQLLVFDRFLARMVQIAGDSLVLKGGLVLELRLQRARTTKDIDVRLLGSASDVLARLQEAGRISLGDYMTFEIQADAHHPEIQNPGMKYQGLRFRAECRLAGRSYGHGFGVDIGFGDPILGEPDIVVADNMLDFAGIEPPTLRIYPVESHVAEKLHAYTLPRPRPNMRVKDLPDLALLASTRELDAKRVRAALEQTFTFRGTHPLPISIPDPSMAWTRPYATMAEEDELPWKTLAEVTSAVRAFLDPALVSGLDARWSPRTWQWRTRKSA